MKKIMFNDKYGLTQAVLDGRKTQTRRLIPASRLQNCVFHEGSNTLYYDTVSPPVRRKATVISTYHVGDVVAVAQRYSDILDLEDTLGHSEYRLDKGYQNKMYVKAEQMPHQIRITKVRVQRLQDISDEDCLSEGIVTRWHAPCSIRHYYLTEEEPNSVDDVYSSAREAYAALMDKLSGRGTWESNPWVFVFDFELIR